MYAQKIEGETWVGERLDGGKIDKMSGMLVVFVVSWGMPMRADVICRPAAGSVV